MFGIMFDSWHDTREILFWDGVPDWTLWERSNTESHPGVTIVELKIGRSVVYKEVNRIPREVVLIEKANHIVVRTLDGHRFYQVRKIADPDNVPIDIGAHLFLSDSEREDATIKALLIEKHKVLQTMFPGARGYEPLGNYIRYSAHRERLDCTKKVHEKVQRIMEFDARIIARRDELRPDVENTSGLGDFDDVFGDRYF